MECVNAWTRRIREAWIAADFLRWSRRERKFEIMQDAQVAFYGRQENGWKPNHCFEGFARKPMLGTMTASPLKVRKSPQFLSPPEQWTEAPLLRFAEEGREIPARFQE